MLEFQFAQFARALKATLVHEGGFANHPADPGGRTLEGVTQRVYDAYRRSKVLPLRTLTASMRGEPDWIAERDEIYRRQYWDACRCSELPPGVAFAVFDAAVNSGVRQAALWLQRALDVRADGHIGDVTLGAARTHPNHRALIADMLARRLGMLRNLSTWADFGAGWSRRVSSVKQLALQWVVEPVAIDDAIAALAPTYGGGKAEAEDVVRAPISEEAAEAAAAASGGLAVALQAGQQTLQPLVGTSDLVNAVYVALVVGAVAVAALGVVGTIWAKRKNRDAEAAINGEVLAFVRGA